MCAIAVYLLWHESLCVCALCEPPCSENTPLIIKFSTLYTNKTNSTVTHSCSLLRPRTRSLVTRSPILFASHIPFDSIIMLAARCCRCYCVSPGVYAIVSFSLHLHSSQNFVAKIYFRFSHRASERKNETKWIDRKPFACQRDDDESTVFGSFGSQIVWE